MFNHASFETALNILSGKEFVLSKIENRLEMYLFVRPREPFGKNVSRKYIIY